MHRNFWQWWSCAALTPPYSLTNSRNYLQYQQMQSQQQIQKNDNEGNAKGNPAPLPGIIRSCNCTGVITSNQFAIHLCRISNCNNASWQAAKECGENCPDQIVRNVATGITCSWHIAWQWLRRWRITFAVRIFRSRRRRIISGFRCLIGGFRSRKNSSAETFRRWHVLCFNTVNKRVAAEFAF